MSGGIPSATGSTSRSLLRRARELDPVAWRKLTAIYTPLVYQWCRGAGLQVSDASDVAQEVFRSVASGLNNFRKERPQDSFRGWLWTITHNKIRDYFRTLADEPHAAGGTEAQLLLQELPSEPPPELHEFPSRARHSRLAQRAISLMQTDFEESTWRAFWLTAVELQPAQAVADQLSMSRAAVYQAKSRVLRHLREELAGLDLFE